MLPSSLPLALLSQADAVGDRVFLVEWDPEEGLSLALTFSQLSSSMLSAALWLRAAVGLRRGDYCALLAHNSAAYVSVTLGAMSLGATSLHLNWRQPEATNTILVTDLNPRVIVASKPFKQAAVRMHERTGVKMVMLESICSHEGPPFPPCHPEDAAALRETIVKEVRSEEMRGRGWREGGGRAGGEGASGGRKGNDRGGKGGEL